MDASAILVSLPELDRWTGAGLLLIGAGLVFAMAVAARGGKPRG